MKRLSLLTLFFMILALLTGLEASADNSLENLPKGWTEIFPGGETSCANGSPYSFHVKPGADDRIMIFFNGGGACWSGDACDINTEPTNYSPLASIAHNDPKTRGGAFDLANPENPFATWSQVYVSYCTGDIHLGSRDMVYTKSDGSEITIKHRGKVNSQAALDWVYKNFESPESIFVSGGSAGAVASPYYAAVVADQYTDTKILHFAGGAGGYRLPPQTALLEGWGVFNDTPDWPELDGYSAETLHFDDLYLVAAKRHPEIRFHQFNGAYDWAQQLFLQLLGSDEIIYPLLTANLADLKVSLPDFNSYVAKGDFHTLLRFDEMYQFETEGVRAVDWVREIAEGRSVADVSCGTAMACQAQIEGSHNADFTNPEMYDLVILDGRVMDPETNFDAVRNIAVNDGRIVSITDDEIKGDKTIRAAGLVVAPGFIDTHLHGMDPFASKLALRDGVTTGLDLEAGAWNVRDWYAAKKDHWQINYGVTAGHVYARMAVHDPEIVLDQPIDFPMITDYIKRAAADGTAGWSLSRSDYDQTNTISRIIDEELRQGALGVGAVIAYMARGLDTYELFEVQRAAARYGRLTSAHTRFHMDAFPPTEAPIGFDEVFTNAMLLKAPLLMAHNNDYGWEEIEEKLQLARAQGLNMWSEQYPYAAGSTVISADFLRPGMWEQKYGNSYEETVYDPQQDSYLDRNEYEKLVAQDPGRAVIIFMPQRRNWLADWLRVPHMTVGSDGMAGVGADGKLLPWDAEYAAYAGHPRTAGSRARTLRMGRELNVPLMHTLAQLSYWSAKHLGDAGLESMQERGRLQEGMVADITIFDPERVSDHADYKAGLNGLPSSGIPWVIVNGTIVVEDSVVLQAEMPGQAIRYPVEEAGRHQPLSREQWLRSHTVHAQ